MNVDTIHPSHPMLLNFQLFICSVYVCVCVCVCLLLCGAITYVDFCDHRSQDKEQSITKILL